MSFNLIVEPFIPCLDQRGAFHELGLHSVLQSAHDLRELRDDSPLVTVALHRLLLAILHRNFGPASTQEWKTLWNSGRFDGDKLGEYLEQWKDHFHLFHPQHPFFQVAGFSTKEASGINRLAQELARGNNATLFDHTRDDPAPLLTPAQAARLIITEQSFAVGGGKSDLGNTPHAPLVGGAIAMPQGRNLFETLMLNLVVYNREHPCPSSEDDAPVWERNDVPSRGASHPAGYLDYLTWQTRTLLLSPADVSNERRVSRVFYAQGRKFDPPPGFLEPNMSYKRGDDGDRPLRFSEDRDLWRDSSALFQFAETDQFIGPLCFRHLQILVQQGVLSRSHRYDVATIGLCTDKAKVSFWRRDRLPLPLAYLDDIDLVGSLKSALSLADDVGKLVRRAAWQTAATLLSNGQTSPDKQRVADLVDSLAPDRLYWSRLEIPFRQLLADLPGDCDHQERAIAHWTCETLRRQAEAAFDETAGDLNRSARELRAVTLGRQMLQRDLYSVIKPHQEKLHEFAQSH